MIVDFALVQAGIEQYYLETTAIGSGRDSGFLEPDGYWVGNSASVLGLSGVVEPSALHAILGGVDPVSGEVLRAPHPRLRNAAIDVVFAPPKSVSLLHALGAPSVVSAVADAHSAAVSAALAYLEREAAIITLGRQRRVLRAEGFVGAAFLHRTSRAPDPHLHTHVLLANLGRTPAGVCRTLKDRPIYRRRPTASALYDAELRARLTSSLGCAWRPRYRAMEVEGCSDRVIGHFSMRRAPLTQGADGPDARRHRSPAKDLATPYSDLVEKWWDRASTLGISERRVSEWCGRVPPNLHRDLEGEVERAVASALASAWPPHTFDLMLQTVAVGLADGAEIDLLETAVAEALRVQRHHLPNLASGATPASCSREMSIVEQSRDPRLERALLLAS